METKEWRTYDKSGWGSGPWQDEPDKLQWTDEATGLPCLVVRQEMGGLCGYVGVPEGHPWHGRNYDDCMADGGSVRVHGGLTFANHCQPDENESRGICHVPGPGEPDKVWWLGFDCAHYMDMLPGAPKEFKMFRRGKYRTLEYVQTECRNLAAQAKRGCVF